MRRIVGNAFALLKRCWRTLVLFEILYRIFSMYIVFPASKWLFNGALRVTGLYCLTVDNIAAILTNPLMLLCFVAIFLIFSLTAMLEISGLITCLYDPHGNSALSVLQVIREGGRDTLRLLQPRNLPLLLITAFLMPLAQLPSNVSLLRLINLPWRSLGEYATKFPYVLVVAGYLALALVIFGMIMCVYQKFVLEDISAKPAIPGALRVNRCCRVLRLAQFVGWIVAAFGLVYILCLLGGQGINRLVALLIPNLNIQYRILMPFTYVLNFVRSSVPPLAAYAFIGAVYDLEQRDAGEGAPARVIAHQENAGRLNAIVFYAIIALCILSLALYDSVLRPILVRMNALEYISGHPTLIVAHRGYFPDCDENTLSAFQSAIEVGVDYVELDVQQTADGVVIVNHDSNFRRVFGVNRNVWESSYEEVCGLSARRSGEHPPTLREVLTLCDPQANFLVELKSNGRNPELARAVYDILIEEQCLDRCIIQSSSYRLLCEFKEIAPEVRCGYILSFAMGSYATLDAADFFSIDYNFVNQTVVDDVHRSGKDLLMWTLNDSDKISEAVKLGVDGVITDDAPLAKTLLLESIASNPLDELIVEPISEVLMPEEAAESDD